MKKLAKRYAASLALGEKSKKYSLQEACELVKSDDVLTMTLARGGGFAIEFREL